MQSIREYVERAANLFGDKTFIFFEDQEVSFNELNEKTGKAANLFKKYGIKKGDKVALYLPNCLEFIYAWIGLNKIGAVMVPINTYFKEKETTYVINHSDSKIIVTDNNTIDMILRINDDCKNLEHIFVIEEENPYKEVLSFNQLMKNESSIVGPVEIKKDDDAAIIYTSGTTGNPKGCVVPQSYYYINGRLWAEHQEITSEDRCLTPLPFFHMNPQILTVMGSLLVGASVIILDRFHPSTWWKDVSQYKATQFHYLGVMPAILSGMPEGPYDRAHKVKFCLGAGLSHEFHEYFEKRFNVTTLEVFGMTETGLNMITPIRGDRKIGTGSMGKLLPGMEAKIVDENDNEVENGIPGELVLREKYRPEGSQMMKGYYKNKEATEEAWRNGWFHTGDIAKRDDEGFFYFIDRKKDIIRRSGENISSMEVEDCVRSHPEVLDAAAVPFPDPIREQEVRVCVILKPTVDSSKVKAEEIIKWCSERLAYFKVPRYVEIVSEFPKTASNKVQKAVLRKTFAEKTYDRVKKGYVNLKKVLEEEQVNVR